MIPKKNKEWKRRKFEELKDLKANHKYFIFFNFSGLSVHDFVELSRKMKELRNQLKVAKNAFLRMIFNISFKEPIAVLAVKEDPIKAVKELVKALGGDRIRGSFMDGRFFDINSTVALMDSPDMSELRGMVIGALVNILSRTLMSLSWNQAVLLHILRQRSEETGEKSGTIVGGSI